MTVTFENKPLLGQGIYPLPEIARILQLPSQKVNRWIKKYWDGTLADFIGGNYSWTADGSKAVSFLTMIEIYIFYELSLQGVSKQKILKAHQWLSNRFKTRFPFAHKKVLKQLNTDGKTLFLDDEEKEAIVALDGSNQLKFDFLRQFFKKVAFKDDLVAQFYPLGPDSHILCDPERQFGHPVIDDTNVYPETIYRLYQADEPIPFIAFTYDLNEAAVKDAIQYCEAA